MEDSNPSAFKHFINSNVIKKIASEIKSDHSSFSVKAFLKATKDFEPLELKARVLLVTKGLRAYLPQDYKKAVVILVDAIKRDKLSGFELWPFSEYFGQFGLDHFDESMKAMYEMTQRFTSEFAIRPFLLKNHIKVLKYFSKWAHDKNTHVRRWVSEGSRPILPWGGKIPIFIMDPTHTLQLLDQLKFDDELYVRKSVANHLNDITKNHPAIVIKMLKLWQEDCPAEYQDRLNWIKKQALRTLIKKGDKEALKLMGVTGKAKVKMTPLKLNQKKYKLHDKLEFQFEIESTSTSKQTLVIDYLIDFMKANGKKGHKVFKLKTFEVKGREKVLIKKSHSLKPITTMKYYSGLHHVLIQINGEIVGKADFDFKV